MVTATSHLHWQRLPSSECYNQQPAQPGAEEAEEQRSPRWAHSGHSSIPSKWPRPFPRAAAAPPAPQRPGAAQCPGTTRHASDGESDAHPNSTYSGSLLHNNRHLTQGSPDFTDSEKGERGKRRECRRGESEGWGRQSQTSISDRSAERPRAATASEVKCSQS